MLEPHALRRTRVPVRLVIGGDSYGDGLAVSLARELEIPMVVVALDGHFYKIDRATHPSDEDQGEWLAWALGAPGEPFPLRRDRAMATLAARAVAHKSRPHALAAFGFTAPWSRTRGTAYTMGCFEDVARLAPERSRVTAEACPAFLGPAVVR